MNRKPKLVVQDAASYQEVTESVDYSDAVKGIRRGMDDVNAGRTKPARQAFAEIRKKREIPRNARP